MARTFKLKPWVYAGLLALSPLTADAAGLGKLTVTSALGQPLRAEIELVSVQKDELGSIMARLASADAFKEARIERGGALLDIRFSIEQKKTGAQFVKLTTVQPVNEPFLDMLVELNWSAGRLLREYTVLLDPPGYAEPQSVQPVAVSTVKSAMTETPVAAPAPTPSAEPAPAPAAARSDAAKPEKAARKPVEPVMDAAAEPVPLSGEVKNYGPVKKGDTLTGIASQLKPEGYSLEQMLVALYQTNKKAFSGNNMHRLKTGQILRVPEEQQLASLGRAEATHEVRAHTADWNAYRQKLASAVAETAAPKEEAPKQEAKGKIATAVEDKAAPAPAPSKDVLKVTKGEAPASGKEMQSLQNRIQSLQEETTAREKSLKEANSRIASLEKNIKEMQHLLELKNKNLAELQKQATAKPEPAPAPKPAVEAPEKPAEKTAEPPKAAEPVAAPAEAPKPAAEPPVEAKPKPKPPVKPIPKPVAPPPAEPGLLDSLLGNPLYLGAGGLLAVLAGGAFFAVNRRRKKSLSSFEDSILTGGDLKANTVFGETAGGVVDTGDTSFLTDFSQAGLGAIDTNDVDPIAEAEVYMAYGRDAQAEEILKEAMAKDPNRHEIHLKLLEIYAARKNLIAFETLAGELYAAIGGQSSPQWEKAAEMGRALDPNNPLYGKQEGAGKAEPEAAAVAAVAAAGVDMAAPTQGMVEMEGAASSEAEAGAETEEEVSADLDFDVDEVPVQAEAETVAPVAEEAPAGEEVDALEFDMGAFAEKPAEALMEAQPETEVATIAESEPGMDFDLDALMPEQTPGEMEAEPEPAPATESGSGGLELDLDNLLAPSAEVPPAEVSEAGADLDFSLDLPEFGAEPVAETAAEPELQEENISIGAVAPEEEGHLDFDFNLGGEAAPAAVEEKAPPAVPELDLSGISLDLEEPTAQAVEEGELPGEGEIGTAEAATKLDLARAYVEMGDTDGAREILEEVLKEGSEQQQADAKQLLASL